METSKRQFNTEFRKKLALKLERIKEKTELISIYNIIVKDINNNFSSNRNGLFINMNILSDECIQNLIDHISSTNQSDSEKPLYKVFKFNNEQVPELNHKLSNMEKNIIKRISNKI